MKDQQVVMTVAEYEARERSQTKHRGLNSLMLVLVLIMGYFFTQSQLEPLYDELSGLKAQKIEKQEIAQIFLDEGYRSCKYRDSLGHETIGVGHLITKSDDLPRCITSHKAIQLLIKDYRYAKRSVKIRYPWAEGEVQKILINMSFQLGEHRLAKFTKTLEYLKQEDYDKAAGEILDSLLYKQTPNRLKRHAARILALHKE